MQPAERAGATRVERDSFGEIEVPEEGQVVAPPANDPKYDTYVPPKKKAAPRNDASGPSKAARKRFILDSIAGTVR